MNDILRLHEHHVDALTRTIRENPWKKGNKALKQLLAYARIAPALEIEPGGRRVWIWSDLHLQHANIIRHCNRPFDNVDEMDRRLLDAWRARVGANDLVVNGGDVGLAGRVTGSILHAVERAPGRKLLVAGNHEIDRKTGRVDRHGHDEVGPMAVLPTDPPLVLTHVPLHAVPDGWVNLHGHVHNNEPPRTPRHLNVCVEHTGYEPVALNDLVELAKKAVADVD
ncbi:MAG: hypothetical protein OXG35_32245 [Acidobacteria bacterium]|nr:hypothetical protein [Acidobacteriota bacterium]